MSLLENRKAFLPLKESTPYTVILTGWTEKEATETQAASIMFRWELEDTRVVSDFRQFPVGTDILASQIIVQTGAPNGIGQRILFTDLMNNRTPVQMWVERTVTGFTNYHFKEFKQPAIVNTTSAAADFASMPA